MKECWVIYNSEKGTFWSESECMWSICVGTFYPTQEDAHEVMDLCGHDKRVVRTIHLFNF